MNEFLKKWQEDKKYRAKIKLIFYFIFIVCVSLLARNANKNAKPLDNINKNTPEENQVATKDVIDIKESYNYEIVVLYNDETYKYIGTKEPNQENITKYLEKNTIKYLYQDNKYYKYTAGTYVLTTKEEVYEPLEYNYLNLENINLYLSKATTTNNHQYLVYIKDVILGDTSNDYFTININDNKIDIDYTPLIKKFNSTVNKLNVKITIKESE